MSDDVMQEWAERCNNCLEEPSRPGGIECHACARYRLRNGTARPDYLIRRARERRTDDSSSAPTKPTPSVYLFRDDTGEVIYVGITGCGRTRFHQHAYTQPWWPEAVTADIRHVATRQDALDLEAALIATLEPRHNTPSAAPGDPARGAQLLREMNDAA